MKKRLLSAALALAMVLTMLPLTVFADGVSAEDFNSLSNVTSYTFSFKWYNEGDALPDPNKTPAPAGGGFYGYGKVTTKSGDAPAVTGDSKLYTVSTGVINGGKWYASPKTAEAVVDGGKRTPSKWLTGTSILVDDGLSLDVDDVASLSIDLHGKSIALTKTANTKLTSLTITNTAAKAQADDPRPAGALTLTGWTAYESPGNFTLKVDDATVSGGLTIKSEYKDGSSTEYKNSRTLTATLKNADVGALETKGGALTVNSSTTTTASTIASITSDKGGTITLKKSTVTSGINMSGAVGTVKATDGSNTGAITMDGVVGTTQHRQTVDVNGGETGTITVAGNSSTVKLVDTTTGSSPANIDITGMGTSVDITGTSKVGTVTIFGSALVSGKVPSGNGPKVTVGAGAEVAGIATDTSEAETKSATVTTSGKISTGGISIELGAVTVNGGQVAGNTVVKSGSLTISNGASVGAVTLCGNDGTTTLNVSTNTNPNAVQTTVNGAVTVDSTKGTVALNITGGEFKDNFLSGVTYKDHGVKGGTFTAPLTREFLANTLAYEINRNSSSYTYTSSFDALVDAYKDNNASNGITVTANVIGKSGSTPSNTITFEINGDKVLDLGVPDGEAVSLPTKVDGYSIPAWYRPASGTSGPSNVVPVSGSFAPPQGGVTLSATSTNDSSDINGVSADQGIKAELVGTTIKLSGTMIGYSEITLTIKTVDNPVNGYAAKVAYAHNYVERKDVVSFTDMPAGGTLAPSADSASMIFNGKTYTLDGSGLRIIVDHLEVTGVNTNTDGTIGANNAATSKKATAEAGNITASGMTNGQKEEWKTALAKSVIDFKDTAVESALSVEVSKITQANVDEYIKRAQTAAARKKLPSGTLTDAALSATGYDTVVVEAYLEVNVSSWQSTGASLADTITMNLTPKYKVYVASTVQGNDPYAIRTGGLSLSGDYGDADVKLELPSMVTMSTSSQTNYTVWAHHNDVNVYPVTVGSGSNSDITIQFKTSDGFSPFIINGIGPVVTRTDKNGANTTYYDKLQTAVDKAEDGDILTLGNYYDGTKTINVNGTARLFTVKRGEAGNSNLELTFNGANVTVDRSKQNEWAVQLTTTTNNTNATTATISTQTAANGTARVSMNSAKAGDRVTITTTAYNGYQAATPIVRTNTNATVPVTAAGSTNATTAQWTFTVPNGATSITITPSFTQSLIPFTDVRSDAWYYSGIAYCYNTTAPSGDKLMRGESDYIFAPERPVKRAEVAVLLYRLGRGGVETPKLSFTDVSTSYYAYNAIVWCYNHEFVRGNGDATFRPEDYITRQELAQMLYNYAGTRVNYNLSGNFTDGGNVPGWAADAMSWAAYYNVLSGTNSVNMSGSLDNSSNALRGQVAVTIMKFHQRFAS